MRVLVFAVALYLIAPGHPDALLAGLPLGQTGTALLTLVIGCWLWVRDHRVPPPAWVTRAAIAAVLLKVTIGVVAPASGWLASYYANASFAPPVRHSLDFRGLEATRIDRQLQFAGAEFPVHFFNDPNFNFGVFRETMLPFSVEWRGHVHNAEPLTLVGDGAGTVVVAVDGVAAETPVIIPPGEHVIDVRYSKPASVEGRLRLVPQDADGSAREWRLGEVTPWPESSWRRAAAAVLAYAASALSVLIIALAAIGFAPAVKAKLRAIESLHDWVAPAVLCLLTAQGLWKSRHLVGRVWTLSGGDDWLAFEMNSRDILLNGWMMTRGLKGAVYYEYPGYCYFTALVHVVTGESLAGVVLVNFLLLAIATLLVYALARRLASARAAYITVGWLLLVQQLAFVRYYTVTLLSENLFFPLTTATVYFAVRYALAGHGGWLAAAGITGGLAAVTRPTMMAYLPCVMVLAMLARVRPDGVTRAARSVAAFVVCWMLMIAPFTLRNYVVSGSPVLITNGQAVTFIRYNIPEGNVEAERKYLYTFKGGNVSAAVTLLQLLAEYPRETLGNWAYKITYALGMVHWQGWSPHPELVATSALYALALILLRECRSLPAMFVHVFIATHMATLLLTIPWNYGYRMLLTMYLFMPIFVGALLARAWERRTMRVNPMDAPAQ